MVKTQNKKNRFLGVLNLIFSKIFEVLPTSAVVPSLKILGAHPIKKLRKNAGIGAIFLPSISFMGFSTSWNFH